jgi:uncharacterized membrane protein YphA (DoxX/SURF4 family)
MTNHKTGQALTIALWTCQILLFLLFAGTGIWKLTTPIPSLAAKFPWMGDVSPAFLRLTAVFDLLGGIGVLLPTLTRVKPGLAVLAALGCALLQISAIGFHLKRGEAANTPFNFVLVALALFVVWGRRRT